jgi:hypothetical protein
MSQIKVFISWSGEESGAVAQVLRQQLPCVIQAIKPFVSSEDVEKGAAWFQQIGSELEKSDFGILCLTNENQNSKWVQFEAGALAGKFSKARVAPLLIDTTPASIKPPLSQFQLTDINNREDFLRLLLTINGCLGENALTQETLKEIFNNWWNPFNQKVKAALAKVPKKNTKSAERTDREILEEILSLVRANSSSPSLDDPFMNALNQLVNSGDYSTTPVTTMGQRRNAIAHATRAVETTKGAGISTVALTPPN